MRLVRRLMLLTIVGVGGVAAFNYWSQNGWPVRPRAATLEAQIAKQQAARLATRAAAKANDAASKVGDTVLPFRVVVLVRVVATMSCTSRPSPVTFGTRHTSLTVPVNSPTRRELMLKAASSVSVTPESVMLI